MHVRNINFWGKDDDSSTICGLSEKDITLAYDGMRKQYYSINSYAKVKSSSVCEQCRNEITRRTQRAG